MEVKNIRTCEICKESYYRRGRRSPKTCSLVCKAKYNTIIQTGKPQLKKGVMKPCRTCGKKMYVWPSQLNRAKYCSMACRNDDRGFADSVRGEKNHRWKGGRIKIGEYVYVKSLSHPNGHKQGGYVAEHRLVMEKYLGRYLDKNEQVHHKDQNKVNNSIENLEIVIKKAHWGNVKCPHCLQQFKIK